MPAPAVIPAPIAYIKVVAVKKLVVGFRNDRLCGPLKWRVLHPVFLPCGQLGGGLLHRSGPHRLL